MRGMILLAGAAMLVGGCMTPADDDMAMSRAAAEPPMAAPAAMALSPASMNYAQMAHSGNMFEIESSRLALQMGRDPTVRQFAQMMIDDHTRLDQEMMMAGRDIGLDMAMMQMAPHHMDMLQRLRNAGPANFDMMYHQDQMMAHQEALNLHSTYAQNGDNETLRALAARAAPAVRMHLDQLQTHRMRGQGAMPPPSNRRAGERG